MSDRINFSIKEFSFFLTFAFIAAIAIEGKAQLFKRESNKPDPDRSKYAYQTVSTQKKKVRKEGYAGDESRFKFEKPQNPLPDGNALKGAGYRIDYFGHKRPPKKRSPGQMKLCRVCEIRH